MFQVLAIDWGTKRIGMAVGDPNTGLVLPRKDSCPREKVWDYVSKEITTYPIKLVVVGKPTNFLGGNTQVTDQVESFVDELRTRYGGLDVFLVDERYTTSESRGRLVGLNKHDLNHLSAQSLLEVYFRYYLGL